jgi:hypothetical protein
MSETIKLIDIGAFPVSNVIELLLKDKTTGENIIFATNSYMDVSSEATEKKHITVDVLKALGYKAVQPRVLKTAEDQLERTKKKAEVFTPSWICNKMNNHCDAEWFGREEVFNREVDHTWVINADKIEFAKPKDWQKYVDSKRLEITCGEAPYIVSRYDTTTAEIIPVRERIGILDRKLRIVNENTDNEKDWIKWAMRAFQSVYGYEFQGDNLLIARINLLMTFVEYMNERWGHDPNDEDLKKITNIIVWNLWQMDGITGTIPFGKPKEEYQQLSLFDFAVGINDTEPEEVNCKIFDWRSNESLTYNSMKRG